MRIGYILDLFPSLVQTFILSELLELERLGFRIHIYSLQSPSSEIIHKDRRRLKADVSYLPSFRRGFLAYLGRNLVVFLGAPCLYLANLIFALRQRRKIALQSFFRAVYLTRLVEAHNLQHLHAHFALGTNVVAMFISRFLGLPYSFTTHATDLFTKPVLLCETGREARFLVTISQYNKGYILNRCQGQGLDSKLFVVHCGIDTAKFSPAERKGEAEVPLILSVGRLVEKKGHIYLVKALGLLRARGQPFRCLIVGEGPQRGELERAIKEEGLEGLVSLTGTRAQEEVRDLYAQADIFVLPCVVARDGDKDGIPVSLMEAMAMGLAVVSTPLSGIPELVEDGENGLLVKPEDLEALSCALARIMQNPRSLHFLGQKACLKARRDFSIKESAQKLACLFRA